MGYGGGQYLRAKGIYENIPTLLSCHVDTALAPSEVRVTAGEATAAAYRFSHRAEGIVAHAALPAQGKNPIKESVRFFMQTEELNEMFRQLSGGYGLVTASEILTPEKELNSLAPYCTVKGISRGVGEESLKTFKDFMDEHGASIQLEAPPVINDAYLVTLAQEVAASLGYAIRKDPARFRDETAWAGRFQLPWANPDNYKRGCERILHFFTSGGENCGYLHNQNFNPSLRAVEYQINMLFGMLQNIRS